MTTQLQPAEGHADFPHAFRLRLIESLTGLRQDWEEAVQPDVLMTVEAPIVLLLTDVLERLSFTEHEKSKVLGDILHREVESMLSDQL